MIISFLTVAFIVYAGFRVIHFIVGRIKLPVKTLHHIKNIIQVLELFLWTAFVFWILMAINNSDNYLIIISVAVIFLLLFVSFFGFIKDFFTGIILKIQDKVIEGTFIEIEEIKGIVKKAGHFRLDIEDKQGNIGSIPYQNIRSKIISRPGKNLNLEKVTLEFIFPESSNVYEISTKLKKAVLNTAWVAVSQAPIIENTRTENGKLIISVGVFVLDKAFAENIRNAINSHLLPIGVN